MKKWPAPQKLIQLSGGRPYGKEALSYSKTLVEGQWWRVFGILLGTHPEPNDCLDLACAVGPTIR